LWDLNGPARRETQGVEDMSWNTPVVVEVCAGMEVTAYLSAQM
jgi:coenzyme PQQ precursor peptide PqqA